MRRANGKKCLIVMAKYEKLLGLRVKDTVFRFWQKFKKSEANSLANTSSFDL